MLKINHANSGGTECDLVCRVISECLRLISGRSVACVCAGEAYKALKTSHMERGCAVRHGVSGKTRGGGCHLRGFWEGPVCQHRRQAVIKR